MRTPANIANKCHSMFSCNYRKTPTLEPASGGELSETILLFGISRHGLTVFALVLTAFLCRPIRADLLGVGGSMVWRINQCTGESVQIGSTGYFGHNSLARDSQGNFLTTGLIEDDIFADQYLMTINPDTGEATPVALLDLDAAIEGTVRSMAFSPDGELYATVRTPFSAGVANLYIINPATGVTTLIGSTGQTQVQGLAFSDSGVLYALGFYGKLGTIDINTGALAYVTETSPFNPFFQSIAFAPNGVLYACDQVFESLNILDTATGVATLIGIGNFGDLRGIEFIPGTQPDVPPPAVVCQVGTATLWSPNREMVNVGLSIDVTESCGHAPKIKVYVLANETDRGRNIVDVQLDTEINLLLEADRNGKGAGRVYLIFVVATDVLGQVGVGCTTVVVPHNKSQVAEAVVNNNAVLAELECLERLAPPESYFLLGEF